MSTTLLNKFITITMLLFAVTSIVQVESSTWVGVKGILTSCTNQPLNQQELPNLSHAKLSDEIIVPTAYCNQVDLISFNLSYTWYYYSVYPPIDCDDDSHEENDNCCFDTVTSTINWATAVRQVIGANAVITRLGSVVDGAYFGKNVTSVYAYAISDQTSCVKPQGLEIWSGSGSFTVIDGPTDCTGLEVVEVCPGLHFG